MPLNLRVNHAVVGPFRGGVVVPTSAVEGGLPECDRLVALGAMSWTEDPPTDTPPAARTAVAEMPDDELTRENERLRRELSRLSSAGEERHAAAVTVAVSKASAEKDAEIARLKAELEAAKGGDGQRLTLDGPAAGGTVKVGDGPAVPVKGGPASGAETPVTSPTPQSGQQADAKPQPPKGGKK